MSFERRHGNEPSQEPYYHSDQHQVEIDGYSFTLIASDTQIGTDHKVTRRAQVACNAEDCLEVKEQERFAQALTKAAELAKLYDDVHMWVEYVGLERAPDLDSGDWDHVWLFDSMTMVEAAIVWSDEHGFPLSDELRSKLTTWAQEAFVRFQGE